MTMPKRLAVLGALTAFILIAVGACNTAAPATLTPLNVALRLTSVAVLSTLSVA